MLLKEVPKPDYWEKHLRSTKHLQRQSTPHREDLPVDTEQEKTTVEVVKSQSPGRGPTRCRSTKGREPPGAAQGRDLVRQRAIKSVCRQWLHGSNEFNRNTEEEQDPISMGAFKHKSTPGKEPSGSARGNPTIQPACIKETNRRRTLTHAHRTHRDPTPMQYYWRDRVYKLLGK